MIKAIIFDWGGVLIDNPAQVLIAYCSSYFNISERDLARVFRVYTDSFQKGNLPENTLWEKVCSELSIEKPETSSLWANAFKKVYSEKKEVFSLASHLRKNGYKIGLLSNTETSAMEFFYEKKYDMFDALVFSCKEGITKPERRIYEIALEKLNVKAEEAIFTDDKEEHIRGAKEAGIHTILFKNPNQLKKGLSSFSLFSWQLKEQGF